MSQELLNQEPNWLEPKFENIPEELKRQPWAVWKAEPRTGQLNKFNKAPRNPLSGIKVGANQPEKFGTFEEAKRAYESGKYTGIGVLLTGNGITGVDLDDAAELLEERPDIKEWVKKAVKAGVYCELSPSNTGLRLFILGNLGGKGRKEDRVEIYDDKRFLTVTGAVKQQKGGKE